MTFILIDFQDVRAGSFGALGLTALLRVKGYRAFVIGSSNVTDLLRNESKLRKTLEKEKPDYVGLSVMTPYADYISLIARIIKECTCNAPIIVGGYHATIFGPRILEENSSIDYVVTGDGEDALPKLLTHIDSGKGDMDIDINGVFQQTSQGCSPHQPFTHKSINSFQLLDEIPFPDEEVLHPAYYTKNFFQGHGSLPSPSRYALFSRGCPFSCSFCKIPGDNGFRSRVRYNSPSFVIRCLKEMKKKYSLKGVAFLDDNFTINKKWAKEVCEGIIRENIGIEWWAQIRANLADKELIKLMRKAGCSIATITIESGDDRIRQEVLNKKVSREQIRHAYSLARRYGMLVQGTLLLGSPSETVGELERSIAFLRDVDPDWAGVLLTTPLPGTSLHNQYKHRIKTTCYRDYDIGLQPAHFGNPNVRLGFHNIEPALLNKMFQEIRNEYDYANRVRPRLRNLTNLARLKWMWREFKKRRFMI